MAAAAYVAGAIAEMCIRDRGRRVRMNEYPFLLSQSMAYFKREMLNISDVFATILLQSVSFRLFAGKRAE